MTTSQVIKRVGPKLGWFLIGLSILVLLIFAVIRVIDTYGGAPPRSLFEARYLQSPVISAIHMFSGIIFVLLAPLQFIPKLRARHLGVHRVMGRVLICCALIAGFYGIVAAVVLPVFGGLASETASWFFGTIFIFALLRAFWCVRNRKIAQHREWMIRAFALALGVGAQRIILGILIASTDYTLVDAFGPGLWMGFGFNLILAEVWINVSRARN